MQFITINRDEKKERKQKLLVLIATGLLHHVAITKRLAVRFRSGILKG